MARVALLHTGAVVIGTFAALTARHWPGTTVVNLLDDRIVADLADQARQDTVLPRLIGLAGVARDGGADAVVFTCSSISGLAPAVVQAARLPVLRIDEAMADEAVGVGARVAVLATLPTTLEPTCALLAERSALLDRTIQVQRVLVEGAFAAVAGGDRALHDRLVAEQLARATATADVVVLAQASMASAAGGDYPVPVLTSPESGVLRVRQVLGLG
jgi:aspartate/glutamate racemase